MATRIRKIVPNFKIKRADFVIGAGNVKSLNELTPLPEVAFLGRSNVGKSTLLNRIANRKRLARTSATPGRTQEINVFDFELEDLSQNSNTALRLIDLPGFGFAKLPKDKRGKLIRIIQEYLLESKNLSIACLLNDIRRDPKEEELGLREILFERGILTNIILTKSDKLGTNEKSKRIKALSKSYNLEPQDFIVSGQGVSIDSFWQKILISIVP